MGTPAKKRKLNSDSKASPSASRNLDFFFNKQKQVAAVLPSNSTESKRETETPIEVTLTDEELARKLQAQWDQEDNRAQGANEENNANRSRDTSAPRDLAERATNGDTSRGEYGSQKLEEQLGVRPKTNPFALRNKDTLTLQSAGSAEETISSNIPFDESPLTFDPSKYVTELQGHWAAEGGDASYALLTRCFVLVNSTQSRIKIVDTLVNLLRVLIEGDPSSLLPTVCTSQLSPSKVL